MTYRKGFTPLESPANCGGHHTDKVSIPYRKGGVKGSFFLTGFTLIEMLVVFIIVIIIAFISLALFTVIMRGSGVKESGKIIAQVVAEARELASKDRSYYFIIFLNPQNIGVDKYDPQGDPSGFALIKIYKDSGPSGEPNKEWDPPNDILIENGIIELPRNVVFYKKPYWLKVTPTSNCSFATYSKSDGSEPYEENSDLDFDRVFASLDPNLADPTGAPDIILTVWDRANNVDKPYKMCLDVDSVTAKVRRQEFVAK